MNVRLNLSFLTDCSILFFFLYFQIKKEKVGGCEELLSKDREALVGIRTTGGWRQDWDLKILRLCKKRENAAFWRQRNRRVNVKETLIKAGEFFFQNKDFEGLSWCEIPRNIHLEYWSTVYCSTAILLLKSWDLSSTSCLVRYISVVLFQETSHWSCCSAEKAAFCKEKLLRETISAEAVV